MGRLRQLTSVDYRNQLAVNMNELDKREKMNVNDVISHRYLQQILCQYERLGLKSDTLLFSIITALSAISCRSFIRRMDNMPILLSHGSLIVGRTGTNKSSYIKLIRHGIGTLTHHYENIYYPDINKYGNQIDSDQGLAQTTELSNTSTKMTKASFMTEVCTELAITKNLATTDTFLCHDEGDVILTTFGFYSPTDSKHASGVNLMCGGLDGLVNYNRTTGRQNIHIENATLSTCKYLFLSVK